MVKRIFMTLGLGLIILCGLVLWKYYLRFIPPIVTRGITITLPFNSEDDKLIFINPMGETDHHTPPQGHPGIDFGWQYPAPLRAVSDGIITKIYKIDKSEFGELEEMKNVEIVSGIYAIRYDEIQPDSRLKVGMKVKQGEVIGRGGKYDQPGGLGVYYSIHWEFDYDTPIFDRICPLTYFDGDSLNRINAIWNKVGQTYNGQFPEICNGFYKGKDS